VYVRLFDYKIRLERVVDETIVRNASTLVLGRAVYGSFLLCEFNEVCDPDVPFVIFSRAVFTSADTRIIQAIFKSNWILTSSVHYQDLFFFLLLLS